MISLIDSRMTSDTDKTSLIYEDDIDITMFFSNRRQQKKHELLSSYFNNKDDTIQIQGTEVFSELGGEF